MYVLYVLWNMKGGHLSAREIGPELVPTLGKFEAKQKRHWKTISTPSFLLALFEKEESKRLRRGRRNWRICPSKDHPVDH